jgi:hypothetical protein
MSKIEVNAIEPQCGTNLTVGASGDTITFPSGTTVVNNGSQTGFGRTGTVDWDTTAKTASFTAVSGNGYFVNTTSGAITVTLPASPSAGDIVSVADYANTFNTNNLTLGRNSSNIEGDSADFVINLQGVSITLVYVDATKGWITTDTGNSSDAFSPPFITATGGTITTCGNCKIHTFTGPGTFCVTASGCVSKNEISYMVIAGGAAGGSTQYNGSGGGGAGGFREFKSTNTPYTASPLEGSTPITVTSTTYPITVGAGGASVTGPATMGTSGSNSVFSTITSTGGGGGSGGNAAPPANPGGSGGGSGGGSYAPTGGAGNTPPTSPPQGNPGGDSASPNPLGDNGAGGGGGAGAAGQPAPGNSGNGGDGVSSSITGSSIARAGGGGGSGNQVSPGISAGSGGLGGGGAGGASGGNDGIAGTTNTGSGGGGASGTPAGGNNNSGAGGSGIVVIRYKFQ